MKNKKGFTLIELLAVIVILAIIALIATPVVLNIIGDSKKESVKISAKNYISAIDNAVAKLLLLDSSKNYDGVYVISEEGRKLTNKVDSNKIIIVEFENEGIKEGQITIKNNRVISVFNGKIDDQYIQYNDGELISTPDPAEIPATPKECFISTTAGEINDYLAGQTVHTDSGDVLCGRDVIIPQDLALPVSTNPVNNGDDTVATATATAVGAGVIDMLSVMRSFSPNLISNMSYTTDYNGPQTIIEKIGEYAFAFNDLTNIVFNNQIKIINNYAFSGNKLTNLVISDTVTKIGEESFMNASIQDLTLGNSLQEIGESAFSSSTYPGSYKNVISGSVTIPNSVTTIRQYAFSDNQITNLTIPDSVTQMYMYAFSDNQLDTINLGNGLNFFSQKVFCNKAGYTISNININMTETDFNSVGKSVPWYNTSDNPTFSYLQ